MAYKIFLDANVLLDLNLKRKGFEEARTIFIGIQKGIYKAYISSSVLHILCYILPKNFSKKVTKEILLNLLEEVSIIDTPQQVAINAISSNIDDTEDALQYYAAMYHQLDYFISGDKQLKKEANSTLPIYNPLEFIKLFEI